MKDSCISYGQCRVRMQVSLFNLEGTSNCTFKKWNREDKLLVAQESQSKEMQNLRSPRRAEGGIRGKLVSARKRARVAALAFPQKCRA